jgi:hypothetical protein
MQFVAIAAIVLGFVATAAFGVIAGFALRRRTNEWCPNCGCRLTVEHCPNAAVAVTRPGWAQCATTRTTS